MSERGEGRDGARLRVTRLVLLMAGVALIAGAAVVLYLAYADDLRYALSQRELAAAVPATPVATQTVESTSTLDFSGWTEEDLAYWHGLHEGQVFGRLVAAKAHINDMVVKGAERDDLAEGPGWIVQTDPPGAEGNCGISGHRTTHGAPFRNLDDLKIGASIDLYSPYRRYTYIVDRILRVTPDHVEVVAHTVEPRLTLTSCDPPGSASKRLVVQGHLVAVVRIATEFGK